MVLADQVREYVDELVKSLVIKARQGPHPWPSEFDGLTWIKAYVDQRRDEIIIERLETLEAKVPWS